VTVRVHLSERVDGSTLPSGARLATVKADRSLAQLTTATPELEDDYTIRWSLSAADWTALANAPDAETLEVSLTSALRAEGWGSRPPMEMPSWARVIYTGADTSPSLPIILREPLTSIASFTNAVPNGDFELRTLLSIESLYLAANPESNTKLLTGFKSAPFVEPATELVYFRNRFYDASTGTWLTPDPAGSLDSNNQYAFCAHQPVDCSDPLGLWNYNPAAVGHAIFRGTDWLKSKVSQASAAATPHTGIAVVDWINETANGAVETQVNAVFGGVGGFVGGFFTLGEMTGEAIGAYNSRHPWLSAGYIASAGTLDAIATVGYATGIAGLADAAITGLSNRILPPAMFDMSLGDDAAQVLDDLAPVFGPRPTLVPVRRWIPREINGRRVYQRSDLFDPYAVDKNGLSNIQRMQRGRPPMGKDGEAVNLHHAIQREPGSLIEIAGTQHDKYSTVLHGLTEAKRSFRYSKSGRATEVEKAFNRYKYGYWQMRAKGVFE
jgi:RHS repeat-associated protein